MTTDPEVLDKIIRLLVAGAAEATVRHTAIERLGLDAPAADLALAEARRKITLAADYNRDAEIGTALTRLHQLFSQVMGLKDGMTALAAQREINRLLSLYVEQAATSPVQDHAETIADHQAALDHLTPLGLAATDAPLAEHARLAVLLILELREAQDGRRRKGK